MRRSIRVERRLDATPASVFEILADHGRYDRFDGIRRSEVVREGDPAPNGLGAVRRLWIGPLRFEEEITAYEPPHGFDYLIRGVRGLPVLHEGGTIRLTEEGGRTHAVWQSTFEVPIRLVGSSIDWLFAVRLKQGFGRVLERSGAFARNPGSPGRRPESRLLTTR